MNEAAIMLGMVVGFGTTLLIIGEVIWAVLCLVGTFYCVKKLFVGEDSMWWPVAFFVSLIVMAIGAAVFSVGACLIFNDCK